MIKIVTTEEMRELDQYTIQELGLPGIVLMERAAQGCVEVILEHLDENDEPLIYIFVGKGNNGGDGLAIARYLYESGYDVVVFSKAKPTEFKGDAKINADVVQKLQIPWEIIKNVEDLYALEQPDIVVDALFGTGFQGHLEGDYASIVEYINDTEALIFSVDIPSGINGNTPLVEGIAVYADATITMGTPKLAHLFYPAKKYVGELYIADIGIPLEKLYEEKYNVNLVEKSDIVLPYRRPDAHKYRFGRILIIAGSEGLMGAPVMAAKAASLVGGGMVHLVVPKTVYPLAASHLLGEIVIPVEDNGDGIFSEASIPQVKNELEWADVVLIGPGMGRHHNTISFINQILPLIKQPVIIDADALYALSHGQKNKIFSSANILITPHYGEFEKISDISLEDIQKNPVQVAREFAQKQKVVVNLKNAPSLVACPDGKVYINNSGNASLAKGGSGDVLAGMIVGLVGMGLNLIEAAMVANYIHGYLADAFVEEFGAHGLTPEIQLELLPMILKEFE